MNRAQRSWTVAVVGSVCAFAVLAGALSAVAATHDSDQHALDAARRNAVAAATTETATVLSYDYRHLPQDYAAAEALVTPAFRKKYVSTTNGVTPLAGKYQVVTTAEVSAAGAISTSLNYAQVLVFVGQTSTSTQLTAPRLDRSRIVVVLVRAGDRWLISDLKPL